MPAPFEFHLRKRPPWPWVTVGVSILVHSLLLFGWITGRLPSVPRLPHQLIVLSQPADGHDQITMRYQLPERVGERGASDVPATRRGAPRVRVTRPVLPTPPEAVTVLPRPETRDLPADSGTTVAPVAKASRIGPGLADGKLWVRPLPLPPRELAQRLSQSRAELLDSAVSAIVQAYLDSMANDPASRSEGPPSWTTEIAGKKFGLDSKNIYIAGLKIPTVVLRFLSIPLNGGNIDQNRAYSHLMDLRADLLYAAQRAETMEEFKQVIREIRLRKEREREFEKNQRTAPPPETPATP